MTLPFLFLKITYRNETPKDRVDPDKGKERDEVEEF